MARTSPRSRPQEALPYRIELWDAATGERRILARAVNQPLARAIFRAASEEHPEARISLCRGNRTVAETEGKTTASARA